MLLLIMSYYGQSLRYVLWQVQLGACSLQNLQLPNQWEQSISKGMTRNLVILNLPLPWPQALRQPRK